MCSEPPCPLILSEETTLENLPHHSIWYLGLPHSSCKKQGESGVQGNTSKNIPWFLRTNISESKSLDSSPPPHRYCSIPSGKLKKLHFENSIWSHSIFDETSSLEPLQMVNLPFLCSRMYTSPSLNLAAGGVLLSWNMTWQHTPLSRCLTSCLYFPLHHVFSSLLEGLCAIFPKTEALSGGGYVAPWLCSSEFCLPNRCQGSSWE